jgi:feruloyl esterase
MRRADAEDPARVDTARNEIYKSVPAFCRVLATLRPSTDSDIKVEVWLPSSGWNGKYQAVGNGGWAGVISYSALAEGVKRGYATSSTDTGHVGASGSFALGHPEKLIDFGYRSVHEMVLKSKTIVETFYGTAPVHSYWNGCSTGGRQGLMEAQRYPGDFDGMLAGAPANPRSGLTTEEMVIGVAALKDPASYIPKSKYSLIHQAVLEKCDAIDGLKDGLIQNPMLCKFDPKLLECRGADGPTCLTTPQVATLKAVYAPVFNPKTGELLYPGQSPGAETGLAVMAGGPEPFKPSLDQFRYVVHQDPNWDWRTFNLETDGPANERLSEGVLNASDPNLKPFLSKAKLILYQGWSDPNVPAENTVNYYGKVVDTLGGTARTNDSLRLYTVPGMAHCSNGEGPNVFDMLGALEAWVEKGQTPQSVIATKFNKNGDSTSGVARTRPLCPYPQVAKYKGSGSIDEAINFSCGAN